MIITTQLAIDGGWDLEARGRGRRLRATLSRGATSWRLELSCSSTSGGSTSSWTWTGPVRPSPASTLRRVRELAGDWCRTGMRWAPPRGAGDAPRRALTRRSGT